MVSVRRVKGRYSFCSARYDFDARHPPLVTVIAALLLSLPCSTRMCSAKESNLAILAAGVQQTEDGSFVASDYQFLPGDFVYFTFQIAGYQAKSNEHDESREISLAYELRPEDGNGVPLTASNKETIETTLNPEDKNWTPKRRASFLIPSFVAAGQFHIHLVVKDLFAGTERSRDFPFQIGGVQVRPSPSITIENFGFLRSPTDKQPLQVPAFTPGDTIFGSFDIAGFQYAAGNQYHVAYGLTVVRPDGKPFLDEPKAAEVREAGFYPAQFVPGTINVTTPADSLKGAYVLTLTVRDLVSNQTFETKQVFNIE
jgi:hypothetical protein